MHFLTPSWNRSSTNSPATTPVVLGWALTDPDEHRDAVDARLDDYGRTVDADPIDILDDGDPGGTGTIPEAANESRRAGD